MENNMQTTQQNRSRRKILFFIIGILVIGLAIFALQRQTQTEQEASNTQATAQAVCGVEGKVALSVSFVNTSLQVTNVTAKDVASNKSISLGSVQANASGVGTIPLDVKNVSGGVVEFTTGDGITKTAQYAAFSCNTGQSATNQNSCAVTEATCRWSGQVNTTQYEVVVREKGSNKEIRKGSVNHPTTAFIFPAEPGKAYTCSVIAKNSCGEGPSAQGESSCPAPTATPVPTAEQTPAPTVPGATNTPIPTNTPVPTHGPQVTIIDRYNTVTNTNTIRETTTQVVVATPTPGGSVTGENTVVYITVTPYPTGRTAPQPTNVGSDEPFNTPTPITELPSTGIKENLIGLTVIGSAVALIGSFTTIFFW